LNSTNHGYGTLNKVNNYVYALLSIVFIIVGLVFFVSMIDAILQNEPSSALSLFLIFLGYAVWSPLFFTFMAYLASEIWVDDEGLQTVFLFRRLHIAWSDIVDVKAVRQLGFRRRGRSGGLLIIAEKGLTTFHRVYGLVYARINQPALVISPRISGYDSLVKQIARNRTKRG
jgi:hypothetical protein